MQPAQFQMAKFVEAPRISSPTSAADTIARAACGKCKRTCPANQLCTMTSEGTSLPPTEARAVQAMCIHNPDNIPSALHT